MPENTPSGYKKPAGSHTTRFAKRPEDVSPMRIGLFALLIPAVYVVTISLPFFQVPAGPKGFAIMTPLAGWDISTQIHGNHWLVFVATLPAPLCSLIFSLAVIFRMKLSRVSLFLLTFGGAYSAVSAIVALMTTWSTSGWGLRVQPLFGVALLALILRLKHDVRSFRPSMPAPAEPPAEPEAPAADSGDPASAVAPAGD